MTFDEEIDQVFGSSIRHVRNIFKIRKSLDENSSSKVVHAIKTKRMDYCDHMYFGMPKQKLIQNTTASFVTVKKKYVHNLELHWLLVSYRIVFKLLFVHDARIKLVSALNIWRIRFCTIKNR